MTKQPSLDRVLHLERTILCAMCSASGAFGQRGAAASHELSDYSWRDAEHRVVYGAILRVKPSSGESLAEQLPAQATRMGFPDVDWNLYLQSSEALQPDISELIRSLKAATASTP